MQLPRILLTAPSSASGKTTEDNPFLLLNAELTMWTLCFTAKSLEQKQEILTHL